MPIETENISTNTVWVCRYHGTERHERMTSEQQDFALRKNYRQKACASQQKHCGKIGVSPGTKRDVADQDELPRCGWSAAVIDYHEVINNPTVMCIISPSSGQTCAWHDNALWNEFPVRAPRSRVVRRIKCLTS